MYKYCVVVGGAGYIGTKLLERFVKGGAFDRFVSIDISEPVSPVPNVRYYDGDVRDFSNLFVELECVDGGSSWVFNLAAIHREPGHFQTEYFDTNVVGAVNVCLFAENNGIENIFFTSSIAPYGKSLSVRDETSSCYPETPYGISKWKAESIHEAWQVQKPERRLIICRPSVIYGPGDPGNILRLVKAVKRGFFFYPGNKDIVKSYGYIYGLIDSVEFMMSQPDKKVIYNYAEEDRLPLKELVSLIKSHFGIRNPTPSLPLAFLVVFSGVIGFFWPKGPVHSVRVKKAAFPTNIKPTVLQQRGFKFKYGFKKSLEHWSDVSPKDFD